jgi:hypothetical protein
MRVTLTHVHPITAPEPSCLRAYVTVRLDDVGLVLYSVRIMHSGPPLPGNFYVTIPRRPVLAPGTATVAIGEDGEPVSRRVASFVPRAGFLEFPRAVLDAVRASHPEIFAVPVTDAAPTPTPEPDDPPPLDRDGLDRLLASAAAPTTTH